MSLSIRSLALPTLFACLASSAHAASINGVVTGPDGKPYMGAFVAARNPATKMTISVLSGADGAYHIGGLRDASYQVSLSTIGFKNDPRNDVTLKGDQKSEINFQLQPRPVQWSELTTYQGRMLLPKTAEHDLSHKDPFFLTCFQSCHSFQRRMAETERDEAGWRDRVKYMNDVMLAGEGRRATDKQSEDFTKYLTLLWGPDSPKPASPEDMPQYKSLVRKMDAKAMNIGYVEYDFPAPNGMGPWSAVEDRDGKMWIPYYGKGNEVVRLDSATGEMEHFKLPFSRTAGIHSVIPAQDGSVWFSEMAMGKFARLDPKTKEISEYQAPALPDGKKAGAHTVRVDNRGLVWASGGPAITSYDPKTEEFRHFDVPATYGNVVGLNNDQWFTSFRDDGVIARVASDGTLSKFQPPTAGKPQRLQVDSDGVVYFSERQGNVIGRLDPATGAMKEFPLPGPEASPYAIGIDGDHKIWYSSHEQDTLGRLDPKTGAVTEYPYPHSEIAMREFFTDSKGRMWYGSSTNNKVGYFFFNDGASADVVK